MDYFRFIFFLILSIGIFVYLFIKPRELKSIYDARFFFIVGGILVLLLSLMGICTVEEHWDNSFILAFLTFKIVSKRIGIGGVYMLRGIGYSMVVVGVIALILGSKKK